MGAWLGVGPRQGFPGQRGKGKPVKGLGGRYRGGGRRSVLGGGRLWFSKRGKGARICRWASAGPGGSRGSRRGSPPPLCLGGPGLGLSFHRFQQLLKKMMQKMEEVQSFQQHSGKTKIMNLDLFITKA